MAYTLCYYTYKHQYSHICEAFCIFKCVSVKQIVFKSNKFMCQTEYISACINCDSFHLDISVQWGGKLFIHYLC